MRDTVAPESVVSTEPKRSRYIRVAFEMGYRVTAAGGVVAPSGRHLVLRWNGDYRHFTFTVRKADREEHGLFRVCSLPVHRLASYQLFGEEALKPGIQTRHLNDSKIDNRLVNIAIGTQSDNMMDRPEHVRKAIAVLGARSPRKTRRKLIDDQVRQIRERFVAGESARTLAKAFGVAHGTISNIVYGRSYKDVVAGPLS